ncbi:Bestrophin, RFP-TM, chloride channel-domain-containing protein [Gigaspora rosea]|uniref:Bestrophin, RFP-TM, chloride channel-domain-containing protein n=1 Tax=Gigaspora rosea TaxID=44941 RepID=A0A397W3I5_9GLOM|nr:Bestrophin, RFP-TM, chloride channel-domain-containing protein [Gigaspora rosea]
MEVIKELKDKIWRLFSLLIAIRIAFLYAILNSILSAVITALYMITDIKLSFKPEFITLISFIVSLLISARTTNAYNRYLEGQSLWTKIRITILNLAGFIRINIDNKEDMEQYTSFLLYFIITIKDFLLIDKIRDVGIKINFKETDNISDNDDFMIDVDKEKMKMKAIIQNINDCVHKKTRELKIDDLRKRKKGLRKRLHQIILNLNIELGKIEKNKQEIEEQEKKGNEEKDTAKKEKVSYDKLRDGILTLTECFSGLERIDESIPFVYSTLLSLTTWIYSLSLSFQVVSDLQWVTVPIIFLTTLFLFGIIELSKQLENPFGIDINDLNLNKFCKGIWKDAIFIITDKGEQISNEKIEVIIKKFKDLTGPEPKMEKPSNEVV